MPTVVDVSVQGTASRPRPNGVRTTNLIVAGILPGLDDDADVVAAGGRRSTDCGDAREAGEEVSCAGVAMCSFPLFSQLPPAITSSSSTVPARMKESLVSLLLSLFPASRSRSGVWTSAGALAERCTSDFWGVVDNVEAIGLAVAVSCSAEPTS